MGNPLTGNKVISPLPTASPVRLPPVKNATPPLQ